MAEDNTSEPIFVPYNVQRLRKFLIDTKVEFVRATQRHSSCYFCGTTYFSPRVIDASRHMEAHNILAVHSPTCHTRIQVQAIDNLLLSIKPASTYKIGDILEMCEEEGMAVYEGTEYFEGEIIIQTGYRYNYDGELELII